MASPYVINTGENINEIIGLLKKTALYDDLVDAMAKRTSMPRPNVASAGQFGISGFHYKYSKSSLGKAILYDKKGIDPSDYDRFFRAFKKAGVDERILSKTRDYLDRWAIIHEFGHHYSNIKTLEPLGLVYDPYYDRYGKMFMEAKNKFKAGEYSGRKLRTADRLEDLAQMAHAREYREQLANAFAANYMNRYYKEIFPEVDWSDVGDTHSVVSHYERVLQRVEPKMRARKERLIKESLNDKMPLAGSKSSLSGMAPDDAFSSDIFKRMPSLGTIIGGIMNIAEFKQRYDRGESIPSAAFKVTASQALYTAAPWAAWGTMAYSIVKTGTEALDRLAPELQSIAGVNRTSFGGFYRDTRAAANMRGAAINAIDRSLSNTLSAIERDYTRVPLFSNGAIDPIGESPISKFAESTERVQSREQRMVVGYPEFPKVYDISSRFETITGAQAMEFGNTATMRQIGMSTIKNQRLNARYTYGQEAKLMAR
jgi:hypothetical protein